MRRAVSSARRLPVGECDRGWTSRRSTPSRAPCFIDGAEPGDGPEGDPACPSLPPAGAGTANIPGFGLLADEFKEPAPCTCGIYDPTNPSRRPLFGRWGEGPRPQAPLNRNDRRPRPALKPGLAQHSPRRARVGREHGCPPTLRRAPNCFLLPVEVRRRLVFPWAILTRRRATARCAALPSRVPCAVALQFRFAETAAASPYPAAFPNPWTGYPPISTRWGYEVTTGNRPPT